MIDVAGSTQNKVLLHPLILGEREEANKSHLPAGLRQANVELRWPPRAGRRDSGHADR